MKLYFLVLSTYILLGCIGSFAVLSLVTLFLRKENTVLYVLQSVLTVALQAIAFTVLYLESKSILMLYLFLFTLLFSMIMLFLLPFIYENMSKPLLSDLTMLLSVGLIVLSRLSTDKAIRQYLILLVSVAIGLTVPYIINRFPKLLDCPWLYGTLGMLLIAVVYVGGEVTNGSKLSFKITESIVIQPSEFAKILFLLFLAGALKTDRSLKQVALTAVLAGAYVVLLVLSKDLGSALVFFLGYVFVVFIATSNPFYLLCGIAGGGTAAYLAYTLFRHVRVRVMVWQNPFDYIDSAGWAVTQSLFCLGSGSWFGMGLLKGNPKSIPYVDQDFIFSAICEEFGVLFGITVIIIILCYFITICKLALEQKKRFPAILLTGCAVLYISQVFLTVGGGINLIPLTGITLPFISYGGSSCMSSILLFFMVQGYTVQNRHFDREETEGEEDVKKEEKKARTTS